LSTATPTIARFEYSRTVHFVDTDASGFAHFSTYIRMMEETEYAFLRSRGLSVVLYDERGTMGFPRLSASLQIHHPLVFDQNVDVGLRLTEIDGKQITYEFKIADETGELAVEGRFQVACCRFPDDKPLFAILTPDHVIEALTKSHSNVSRAPGTEY
jgi:acyl-CoA thioester hydrolase